MAIHQLAGNRTRDEKKEFSNSSGRVRLSSRTKSKCSDELANQPAGEAYEQQVKTPQKEPDGTGEVL
ncbi:MAG: hypothetical protein UF420_04055 [Ellagibacter isourolithinifaciens]|uniref:hypothetical protein n=1 Tax=Ellagibacter isourolithinifaciens TaxID=2137581 RepID=UPI002E780A9E|nr:hypothetical protein [Ellagibacter isourolithinifaciens]MEE0044964.1 hypothetical protein [Ellagibacter isourolithinifaciens]MEE1454446.1 hypothetical protein [Ellagibacter isourolithinifaciens]